MKDLIVWMEDRRDIVSTQIGFLEKKGFEVKVVSTLHRLADILSEEKERIVLIILDVMLFSVQSLKAIGKENISTEGGYEAGWVIAKVFLRSDYKDIPILIVSVRPLKGESEEKLEDIKLSEGAWVKYIEKGSVNDSMNWNQEFEKVIEEKLGFKEGDKNDE